MNREKLSREEVRQMLRKCNSKPAKLKALSYVSLSERERLIMQYRYLDELTLDEVVTRIPYYYAQFMGISLQEAIQRYEPCSGSVKKWEKPALNKCADVWPDTEFISRLQKEIGI